MPEVGEVALMADAIRQAIDGEHLSKITLLGGRYIRHPNDLYNLKEINQACPMKISVIHTKGKFCWIELERDWYIGIIFAMSGSIRYEPTDAEISQAGVTRVEYMKHYHFKFETLEGHCFYFADSRNFGQIILSTDRVKLNQKLNSMGPDILTGSPISDEQFIQIFRSNRFNQKNICQVLMGQKAISGVGNYMKAEILYREKINPWAIIADLNDMQLTQLHHQIRQVAQEAYFGKGASLYTYTGVRNEKGTFQEKMQIYNKHNDPLGHEVLTITTPDKRTTHYVPCIQIIGQERDPIYVRIKLKIRIRSQSQSQSKKTIIRLKHT